MVSKGILEVEGLGWDVSKYLSLTEKCFKGDLWKTERHEKLEENFVSSALAHFSISGIVACLSY